VFLFIPAVVAQRSAPLVEMVDVMGNRLSTDAEIMAHIKVRPGDKWDEAAIHADLKTLLRLGSFDDKQTKVMIEAGRGGGINVIFEVRELPLIAEISLEGLKYVTEGEMFAELSEHVQTFRTGMPYDPTKLGAVRDYLIKYLAMRGFDRASVNFSEEGISDTSIKISLVISEIPADPLY
jgi:outer membrane protein assembly factor BamA